MGIGASIILIAIGLVLALAVDYDATWVDLETVGWILTGVGAAGLAVTLVLLATRRGRPAEDRVIREQNPPY